MRKIIVAISILLIGLFVLSGCNLTNVGTSDTQPEGQTNGNLEQGPDQQEAGNDKIPTPPALPED